MLSIDALSDKETFNNDYGSCLVYESLKIPQVGFAALWPPAFQADRMTFDDEENGIGAQMDNVQQIGLVENTKKNVRFIDLFCGLGGIRLGFEQALKAHGLHGECVFSSDIKPAAIKAYMGNFGTNPRCDITKKDPKDIPNFDFLLAGYPCQAFSSAGLGLGFDDARWTLFFNVADIIREKRPQGFVLENVEGLVRHDSGHTFQIMTNIFGELGYRIRYKVLDSSYFGLAQRRKRIYIIGRMNSDPLSLDNFPITHAILADIIDESIPPIDSDFTRKLFSKHKLKDLYGKAIRDK